MPARRSRARGLKGRTTAISKMPENMFSPCSKPKRRRSESKCIISSSRSKNCWKDSLFKSSSRLGVALRRVIQISSKVRDHLSISKRAFNSTILEKWRITEAGGTRSPSLGQAGAARTLARSEQATKRRNLAPGPIQSSPTEHGTLVLWRIAPPSHPKLRWRIRCFGRVLRRTPTTTPSPPKIECALGTEARWTTRRSCTETSGLGNPTSPATAKRGRS
jgi:hypothetical protein